jgi:hypothetical protein
MSREVAFKRIQFWVRARPLDGYFRSRLELADHFEVAPEGVDYYSPHLADYYCTQCDMRPISRLIMHGKLSNLQAYNETSISLAMNPCERELQHRLITCGQDPECMLTSVKFVVDCTRAILQVDSNTCEANAACEWKVNKCQFRDPKAKARETRICNHQREVLLATPEPQKAGAVPEPLFIFKHTRALSGEKGKETMQIPKPVNIYNLEFIGVDSWVVGMRMLHDQLKEECVCDRGKSEISGCNTYIDPKTHARKFWCFISPSRIPACVLARGIPVSQSRGFRSDGEMTGRKRDVNIFWTEALCTGPCACTGLGGYPLRGEKLNPALKAEDDAFWKNMMNYGSSCKRWTEDTEASWCFVGFDTTCPDRWLTTRGKVHVSTHPWDRSSLAGSDLSAAFRGDLQQWKSRIALDSGIKPHQDGISYCDNFGRNDIGRAMSACTGLACPAAA